MAKQSKSPAPATTPADQPKSTPRPPAKPSVGSIVHYVLEAGIGTGAHRPAIIVRVWEGSGEPALVQLQVFTDGPNDGYLGRSADAADAQNTVWRSSVKYSADATPGTWHQPEAV